MGISDKLRIQELENDRRYFTKAGIDIVKFVYDKKKENPQLKMNFYDHAGDYYKKPEHFYIGDDLVYKKKQYAGEVPAEIVLAYAYNYLGIPSPIAYPFFMSTYIPKFEKNALISDGVITKDVQQIFPTAEKRGDFECHTIHGLYTSDICSDITAKGKLSRVKETLASIAFNNKDAGYDNSFWIKNPKTNKFDGVVSIDHGYAGRDSAYQSTKDGIMKYLYFKGEHGYNGMYYPEEDRRTVMGYLKRLLNGEKLTGVRFTDSELHELDKFIQNISKLDFKKIAQDYTDRFVYQISPAYMDS